MTSRVYVHVNSSAHYLLNAEDSFDINYLDRIAHVNKLSVMLSTDTHGVVVQYRCHGEGKFKSNGKETGVMFIHEDLVPTVIMQRAISDMLPSLAKIANLKETV